MTLIFNQCRLIDGISPEPRESCDVVVKDDRLVAIENSRNRSTGDSTVITASGYTMLPGLIDCHTHYVVDPWERDPFGLVELESDAVVICVRPVVPGLPWRLVLRQLVMQGPLGS